MNDLTPFTWFAVIAGLIGMVCIAGSILFDLYQEYTKLVELEDE